MFSFTFPANAFHRFALYFIMNYCLINFLIFPCTLPSFSLENIFCICFFLEIILFKWLFNQFFSSMSFQNFLRFNSFMNTLSFLYLWNLIIFYAFFIFQSHNFDWLRCIKLIDIDLIDMLILNNFTTFFINHFRIAINKNFKFIILL